MGGLFETLSGAKAARQEGKNLQIMEEHKAQIAEQTARAIEIETEFNQLQQAKRAADIKSELQAKLGAAGATGSPVAVDITEEQARELDLENLLIGFEGEVGAQRQRFQADIDRLQGQFFKQRGKAVARQANIGFGLQLASLATPFIGGFGGGTTAPRLGSPGVTGPHIP